jgi:hypothetical protein
MFQRRSNNSVCRDVERDNINIWGSTNLHAVFGNATEREREKNT